MEASSNEQGGDSLANDWRTQHEPNLRKKVTYAIVEMLKIYENDIKKSAIKYEDKIYGMAKDKDDYLQKISRKVNGIHRLLKAQALNQGQSLPTSLPYTQTPTSQQWLPESNIQSNLNRPDSSGLPTQVPVTVSAAQNLNIHISEEGVHSNLLPGPQREIQQLLPQAQQQPKSSKTMFQHQMGDQQLQYIDEDCTGKNLNTGGGDWREETYQKIKALKENYVHVMSTLLQIFSDKLRDIDSISQQKNPHETVEWVKRRKLSLEEVLEFLNVCKSSVSEFHRDKFSLCEAKVLRYIEYHQTETRRTKQQQQQVYQQPQTNQQHQLQIPENEWKEVRIRRRVNSKAEFEFQKHLSSSQRQLPKPLASPDPISVEFPVSNANQIQTESQEHPLVTLPPEPISERPIDRLIKAIKSSSPESLAQSVSEMRSVISLTDRFAGSFHTIGGSRARLGEDLSESTRLRLQQEDTNPTKRFKSSVTTMPLDSTASSDSKVNTIEPSYALLQEIREINGRLLETVVNICNEDVCASEVTSGTVVVTCSYVPVALSATFKALYNSGHISQIQPLRLLVPESYPCSPILLDKVLFDTTSVYKYEDLSERTRSRFGLSIEEYSEPMSLKEIAKVWDECARATMVEYAERHGGGTFSCKYGRWESVVKAS